MIRVNTDKSRTSEIMKRLAVVLVAVVFVFGTALIPSQIYAVETDDQDTAVTEAVEPEAATDDAVIAEDGAAEEAVETETTVPDAAEPETEEPGTDLSDLIVINDANGNSMDLGEIDESQYDGFLYKLEEDTTKAEVKEMENAIDDLDADQEVEEVIKSELYAADSVETIGEVIEPEKIEYIEPNYIFHACDVPNDPEYPYYSWQLENTNVPDVWEKGMFGAGAVVAVLDSGVKMNHPDLKDISYVNQHNVINGTSDVTDDFGHGTEVTGLIAETRDNGIGFTGAMPNVSIMPVKVLNSKGTATTSIIISGIEWAVSKKADVINMSFGGTVGGAYSVALENACKQAVSSGVILVAAAGNEGDEDNPIEYPASYDCVISVGSVNENNTWSPFSNYNNKLTVVAPGEEVYVVKGSSSYETNSGTSFATPQVSALAAMVKSYHHGYSPAKFMDMLKVTSVDLGPAGYDEKYGYGLIDFSKVFEYSTTDIYYKNLSLSGSTYVYDGGVKTPGVTVSLGSEKLVNGTDYTVSYASGRKAVGTYNVTVAGIGKYRGTKTASFTIIPPLVKSIKAPTRQKKKLTVRWNSMSKSQKKKYSSAIAGYQVRVSTSSSFANAKYVKVKGITKTKVAVKGLKKKTNYYVQYRSYKTVGSATYYSKWSSTKKAKTK